MLSDLAANPPQAASLGFTFAKETSGAGEPFSGSLGHALSAPSSTISAEVGASLQSPDLVPPLIYPRALA